MFLLPTFKSLQDCGLSTKEIFAIMKIARKNNDANEVFSFLDDRYNETEKEEYRRAIDSMIVKL